MSLSYSTQESPHLTGRAYLEVGDSPPLSLAKVISAQQRIGKRIRLRFVYEKNSDSSAWMDWVRKGGERLGIQELLSQSIDFGREKFRFQKDPCWKNTHKVVQRD
jgi:hypothetical protein